MKITFEKQSKKNWWFELPNKLDTKNNPLKKDFFQKLPKLFKPKFKYDLIRVGNKHDGGYLISSILTIKK